MINRYLQSLDIHGQTLPKLGPPVLLTRSISHHQLTEGIVPLTRPPPTLHRVRSSPSILQKRTFNYVNIIISGYRFKTLEETLQRFPDTLLGSPKRRAKYWNEERGAYVFTRCRQSFESILYFYQSGGSIVQPVNVEQDIFLDEAKFFKLPLLDYFIHEDLAENGERRKRKVRTDLMERVYTVVQDSNTVGWKALALFDVSMTFVFVSLQCLRTMPELRDETAVVQIVATAFMCILWFFGIFLLRLYIADDKKVFAYQFMSIVDVAVIITFLIDFIIYLRVPEEKQLLGVTTFLRITGFLRLFNMARYSQLLFCLGVALKRSLADLAQVMVLIFLVTFIFATLAYYIEQEEEGDEGADGNSTRKPTFSSVFDALYWGTITISTVGYGDIYPKSAGGKSVGAMLALLGLPLIAIPMPLIMSKFDAYYRDVKRKKENNEVRDKIMEDMRSTFQDSDSDGEPRPHRSQLEPNGKRPGAWSDALLRKQGVSPTATETRTLTPNERSNMSWNDVVKETYGFGQHGGLGGGLSGISEHGQGALDHSSSSRICLSFSDLSRIFGSLDTLNNSHGDPSCSLPSRTSLPSLADQHVLSPMICYKKVGSMGGSAERLDQTASGDRELYRRASTNV